MYTTRVNNHFGYLGSFQAAAGLVTESDFSQIFAQQVAHSLEEYVQGRSLLAKLDKAQLDIE